jgi:hypothetical protein
MMSQYSRSVLFTAWLLFSLGVAQRNMLFAEGKLTAEGVVAKHLQSIGTPELLKKIQSRAFRGTTSYRFIQGMTGIGTDGEFLFASTDNKLAIVLKYKDVTYPGEYLAFDGNNVTVGNMKPGQKSPLADFIFRYNGLMKEGLLGGVLSVSWPLLDMERKGATLKYKINKIEGRQLHELEYHPKRSIGDMIIKMYFDFETFRHVRTDYKVKIRNDSSTVPEGASRRRSTGISRYPGDNPSSEIFDVVPDSNYHLIERFDDFVNCGGLMLPGTYSYEYAIEGQGSSFLGHWEMKTGDTMVHNGEIREDFFKAYK